jgi:hypothetical protein
MPTSASLYGGLIEFSWNEDLDVVASANGDPMVVGAITGVTATPALTGSGSTVRNGAQINPSQPLSHAWDGRIPAYDDAQQAPSPASLDPLDSLVKSVSLIDEGDWSGDTTYGDPSSTQLATAGVLSVIGSTPSEGLSFRPAYFGPPSDKTIIPVSSINESLLPTVASIASLWPVADATRRFERLQLGHMTTATFRRVHPWTNMDNYDGFIARSIRRALVLLCSDTSIENKRPLLYHICQYAIDQRAAFRHTTVRYHAWRLGLMAFVACIMEDTDWQDEISGWAAQ